MPVDYEAMLAHAKIGEEVCRIVRESGLMVPRQKPGRKVPKAAKPAAATKAPVAKKREEEADPDDD